MRIRKRDVSLGGVRRRRTDRTHSVRLSDGLGFETIIQTESVENSMNQAALVEPKHATEGRIVFEQDILLDMQVPNQSP